MSKPIVDLHLGFLFIYDGNVSRTQKGLFKLYDQLILT